jgi:hypothetical protein
MDNQAKLTSFLRDPFWTFGVLIPHNHAQGEWQHRVARLKEDRNGATGRAK